MKNTFALLISFFLATSIASAQYNVNNTKSQMTVDGSSNIHDWTETVETINGSLYAVLNGSTIQSITALKLNIPVKSLKSGKSTMDKNTYKAFNEPKFPNITYDLQSVSISGDKAILEGNLSMAGFTGRIRISTTYKIVGNSISLKGEYTFKMTDFKIDPPTALMGTMTTGDQVTVKFNLIFNK